MSPSSQSYQAKRPKIWTAARTAAGVPTFFAWTVTRSPAATATGVTVANAAYLAAFDSATVTAFFAMFPKEMVLALAGLALLNTIGNGLASAVRDEKRREPALVTFLVTASGLHLLGIGAAFWGIVAGILASVILHSSLDAAELAELVQKTGALGALSKTHDAERFVADFDRLFAIRPRPYA